MFNRDGIRRFKSDGADRPIRSARPAGSRLSFSLFALPIFLALTLFISGCSNLPITGNTQSSSITQTHTNNTIPITTLPIATTGCGKATPAAPGTSVMGQVDVSGMMRYYLLHIPLGYQDTVAGPLVLNFHGHGSNALQQQYRTGFSALADKQHIIVAYPQGVIGPDHHTGWNIGPRWDPQVNDVLFTSDLLNHLQATLCINPDRIYATGFSNGGGMTNLLACKLAGRFAAFASDSGSYPAMSGGCHPLRPVPLLEIHGTGDHIVPYGGSLLKGYPPIALWLHSWAVRDGCTTMPTVFLNKDGLVGEKWTCRDNTTLVHYRVTGMPHMWPLHFVLRSKGSVVVFDATTTIWNFFQQYALPVHIVSHRLPSHA